MRLQVLKILLPSVAFTAGVLFSQMVSYGTPAYAKKESAKCTQCHVAMGKKDLNDTGKCYKEHQHTDLKGCEAKK